MNDRRTTSYLKGLAIAAVLVSHYTSYYASGFYNEWLAEYASEIVSVFFILSGYGIYHSFRRQYGQGGAGGARALLRFFTRRALRIYPLYWAALLMTSLILPDYGFATLHQFSLKTLAIYMALPVAVAPGVFWFIPALVQCYLAAPLCYWLLRRLELWGYLALTAAVIAIFTWATYYVNGAAYRLHLDPQAFLYRNFLLANVFLFALGMSIPVIVERYREKLDSLAGTVAALTLFAASIYIVRSESLLFPRSGIYLVPLFMLGGFLFCLTVVATGPPLPLGRVFTALGARSYPLYLFHRSFYGLLVVFGVAAAGSIAGIIITLALMPFFLAMCALVEEAAGATAYTVECFLMPCPAYPAGGEPAPVTAPVKPQGSFQEF